MNDIVLAVITTVIGLVGGGVITVYLTKRKTPSWACKLNVLFNNGVSNVEDLEIKYKNFDVDNLSSVYLAFWNNGKETIKSDEVVEKLVATVKEPYKIYFAEIVKTSRDSNQFKVISSNKNKDVEIEFKYLDYNQGAVIHIFTDCISIDDIEIKGAIMGCKKLKKFINKKAGFIFEIFPPLMTVIASIISMEFSERFEQYGILGTIIFGIAVLACFSITYIVSYHSRLKNKIPKEFREYF